MRDPELNLYDPANPNQPPYSAECLETFATAQIERNRRITAWVKNKLAGVPGVCDLGDPQVVNDGPGGLARFCTLRSWLSQWSYDDARCDAVASGAKISVPVLVIGNTADDACTPSHTNRLFESVGHDRKQLHLVQGATHYYTGPDGKSHLTEAVGTIGEFLDKYLASNPD